MPLPRLVSELPLLQDHLNGLEQLQFLRALVTFINALSLSLILDEKTLFSIFSVYGSALRNIFTTQPNIYSRAFSQR